jgi:cytochrome c oxidase subunit 2
MDHISPVLWQFLVKVDDELRAVSAGGVEDRASDGRAVFLHGPGEPDRADDRGLLVVSFSILYSKKRHPQAVQIEGSTLLEATWTIIPLGLFLIMFVWGALLYFRIYTPPANAMNIYVVGKQWMWKAEHPGGQHEINALHVPTGQPVQLTLDLAGCVPQLFDSRIPRKARGHSRPLHHGLV